MRDYFWPREVSMLCFDLGLSWCPLLIPCQQTIQKVPILVDVEPSAGTLKHTGDVPLINSEAVHYNSGSKSCELPLLSEESYCVQKHRSLSPGAKLKLFPSSDESIQGK